MGGPRHNIQAAADLARILIAPLGRRWAHVQAVAACAEQLRSAVEPQDGDALVMSAWLHDIGYAPAIGHTRFHPLDGARHLRTTGWPALVVDLVAHHSGARYEAEQRGLTAELAEFPFHDSPLDDALATADLTTGPDGRPLLYAERIAEILARYPSTDPIHRAWQIAGPILADAVTRTRARVALER